LNNTSRRLRKEFEAQTTTSQSIGHRFGKKQGSTVNSERINTDLSTSDQVNYKKKQNN